MAAVVTCMGPGTLLSTREDGVAVVELPWRLANGQKALCYVPRGRLSGAPPPPSPFRVLCEFELLHAVIISICSFLIAGKLLTPVYYPNMHTALRAGVPLLLH